MANGPRNSDAFLGPGRKKFNLNLRPQGQIRDGEQAHPDIAHIDAKSIQLGRSSEYMHGGVQQLTPTATPVLLGIGVENHPVRQ